MPKLDAAAAECILSHTGRRTVEDGAIRGRQDPPGRGLGAYLVSDDTFGDFGLTFEAKPDWPADTGIMLRATPLGSQEFQVLLDHRKSGGFFGNGIGWFHAITPPAARPSLRSGSGTTGTSSASPSAASCRPSPR